jgi:single-strand DNA-binding protein
MGGYQINHVTITGNLTRDPELRALPSGTTVCRCRIAHNARRKHTETGEWVDVPNFFDVVIFGALGERFAQQTAKGEKAAFDGTLRWREWDTQTQEKRQGVEIVATTAIRIPRDDNHQGPPVEDEHLAGATAGDDDIPF